MPGRQLANPDFTAGCTADCLAMAPGPLSAAAFALATNWALTMVSGETTLLVEGVLDSVVRGLGLVSSVETVKKPISERRETASLLGCS